MLSRDYYDGSKKKSQPAHPTQQRAGVIPVELFSYVLKPDELAGLKRYAAFYLAKYGLEEETEQPEREAR